MNSKVVCWFGLVLALMGGLACSSSEKSSSSESSSSGVGEALGNHRADLDPSIGSGNKPVDPSSENLDHQVTPRRILGSGKPRPVEASGEHYGERWGEMRPPDPVEGRDEWQKPKELLTALGIAPGQVVADLGAGTGYFMPHLVEAVGAEGKVVAIEVSQQLVNRLDILAKNEGKGRVQVRLGEFSDPRLAQGEVDWVIVVQTYAHIDERVDYFQRLKAAMKPGGRLAVVDFVMGDIPEGPPPEERIHPSLVQSEMKQAGWTLVDSPGLLEFHFVQVYSTGS